jgi:acetoin utilization deacetylase AcuC-like enzyme
MHKTGYFTHPDCRRHDMGRGHPECPARLDAIEDRMLASGLLDAVERREAPLGEHRAASARP